MSREKVKALAQAALRRGQPLAWFEQLYSEAVEQGIDVVPWADQVANPNLVEWLDREDVQGSGRAALCVGCGLGDDAEELAVRGFRVTGFDLSPSAIRLAEQRFPHSQVDYQVQNLLDPPQRWLGRFDFVHEAYTLQVLPPDLRREAIRRLATFLRPGGWLLVICRARDEDGDCGQMPWPLTRAELEEVSAQGLVQLRLEDYVEQESPPVRRFRAAFQKPA